MVKIPGGIWFTAKWWMDEYGIIMKDPMLQSMDEQLEQSAEMSRLMHKRYGHLGLGSLNPEPYYQVPQYDGRDLTAFAYGAGKPRWESLTSSYWVDKSVGVWGHITDAAEIAKIKIPDWDNHPLVNEMIERFYKEKDAECFKKGNVSFPWTYGGFHDRRDGSKYNMLGYMTVIDLAPFLYGDTLFFGIVSGEENEDLTYAILEKCYEISQSYAEYTNKHFNIYDDVNGWSTMGGDFSCVMSPSLYEKFCKPYDLRRNREYQEKGMHCVNLHSCGKSDHLYEVWGRYPDQEEIKVMQTRGIPGKLAQLRKELPYTWIQWTLHQPQCDFENISQEEVEKTLVEYAEAAGYENLDISAVVCLPGENTDKNVEAFYRTMEKINETAGQTH